MSLSHFKIVNLDFRYEHDRMKRDGQIFSVTALVSKHFANLPLLNSVTIESFIRIIIISDGIKIQSTFVG